MFMSGPTIIVHGNADHAPGNTMDKGKVIIHGSAGDAVAHSMRGGRVYVRDNIGYRGGIHMKQYMEKRPILVVGGSARAFLGEYMAGGLLIVLGLNGVIPVSERGVGSGIHGGEIIVRGMVDGSVSRCRGKAAAPHRRTEGDDPADHRGLLHRHSASIRPPCLQLIIRGSFRQVHGRLRTSIPGSESNWHRKVISI